MGRLTQYPQDASGARGVHLKIRPEYMILAPPDAGDDKKNPEQTRERQDKPRGSPVRRSATRGHPRGLLSYRRIGAARAWAG